MPDVTKLPKWAQHRLLEQDRELVRNKDYIAALESELAGNDPDAATHYQPGYRGPERPLPENTIVHFSVRDYEGRPSRIRVMVREDEYSKRHFLDINGDRGYFIEPRSGNSVYLTPKD